MKNMKAKVDFITPQNLQMDGDVEQVSLDFHKQLLANVLQNRCF